MAGRAETSRGQVLTFGPFRLHTMQRVLQQGQTPVRLGSRSLDILLILVERAGELVGKDELIARVWPNMVVEDAALRVHVSALRKVLGHGQNGARYVENVTGRGYRFVAEVTRIETNRPAIGTQAAERRYRLPLPLTRMIGRTDIVGTLAERLPQQRFVTVAGPGGMGKTTVALAAADKLSSSYRHGACFVDLASITDCRLVPSTLASVVGLDALSDGLPSALAAFLGNMNLLVVLDNCEHVVEAAAMIAETLLRAAPGVHILATSREPLRSEGEWVHRLQPLEIPPASAMLLTAAEVVAYPAIELFVERAMANLDNFELNDADASIVADICRRLDGIPLAIELAAARVNVFGIQGLAMRLDQCLRVLTKGRRTALPRHQTLRATLDWSFGLLSGPERVILRRIAVFPASFDLASASTVVVDRDVSVADMLDGISSLSAKSLISTDATKEPILFRLLDTTRTYALEKLEACNESARIRRRHAELCCADWDAAELWAPSTADWVAAHGRKIDDVRAALDWSFSPDGDASMGVKLAAASAPLWFKLSLADEYRRRLEKAVQTLEVDLTPNAALEMTLVAMLGHALTHAGAPTPAVTAAFRRALDIADLLGDTVVRWQALWGLGLARLMSGDYPSAVDLSKRALRDSLHHGRDAPVMCDRLLALAHHYAGSQTTARCHAERVLSHPNRGASSLGVDHWVAAGATLCRILWIQGFPDQALRAARNSVEDGLSADHTLSICYALFGACPVMLWSGDMPAATRLVAMLLDHSCRHSVTYWHVWGRCFDLALELGRGERSTKIRRRLDLLRDPLLSAPHLETLCTFREELVGAETIARAETGRAGWCAAEILRAQGEIILRDGALGCAVAAETLFRRSLDMARQQGALSWELRAATSLARLWRDQERTGEAHDLLAPVHAQFTEGFGTADLVKANALLVQLTARLASP